MLLSSSCLLPPQLRPQIIVLQELYLLLQLLHSHSPPFCPVIRLKRLQLLFIPLLQCLCHPVALLPLQNQFLPPPVLCRHSLLLLFLLPSTDSIFNSVSRLSHLLPSQSVLPHRLSSLRLALKPAGNKPCLDVAASPSVNPTSKNCPKLSKLASGTTSIVFSSKVVTKKLVQRSSNLNLRTSGANLRDRLFYSLLPQPAFLAESLLHLVLRHFARGSRCILPCSRGDWCKYGVRFVVLSCRPGEASLRFSLFAQPVLPISVIL